MTWGVLELRDELFIVDERGLPTRALVFRDPATGAESTIPYPRCLPPELDLLVREEYCRLAMDKPLTIMNPALFEALFAESHCSGCRWLGPGHEQIHRECHFAGYPVNFEPNPITA